MATQSQATPKTLKVQRTIFDLDTMDELLVSKTIAEPHVSSLQEAQNAVGGDHAKLLDVINRGLRSIAMNNAVEDDSIAWQVENEDGTTSEFSGTPADAKIVNATVLNLAKSSFGYLRAKNADEKRAAKDKAREVIKSVPAIRDGMKAEAKLAASQETE